MSRITKSNWAEKAKLKIKNKKGLNYSAQIAMRILSIIEDTENFNQESLAATLEVSPQQISKILKGQQNLTLNTIGNLSDALGFELISFPPYKDSFIRLMPPAENYFSNNLMETVTGLKQEGNKLESTTESSSHSIYIKADFRPYKQA